MKLRRLLQRRENEASQVTSEKRMKLRRLLQRRGMKLRRLFPSAFEAVADDKAVWHRGSHSCGCIMLFSSDSTMMDSRLHLHPR
ncbi:hypothetical protein HNY73_009333 [Argiope bruennichi]|uniref:Uncharacterized protein n=1 Tax=Argiope bruennichi TaxID=94029 RepID=A0A8T0FED7_ARGBR|nr:hypothetical protein HNY73_009333 [Argiope bruennichi]